MDGDVVTAEIFGWLGGEIVSLTDPKQNLDHVTLEHCAISLAFSNRFNGAMGECSTAAHCVRVSATLPETYALAGLVHDLGEVVTGDIPSPQKTLAPGIVELEHAWRLRLLRHFLGWHEGARIDAMCSHPLVKEMDGVDYFGQLDKNLAELRRTVDALQSRSLSACAVRADPMLWAAAWIDRFNRLTARTPEPRKKTEGAEQ